ncbi:MAG: hypothetical protein ACT4OI_09500, partial [Methanobacteriota archaeon]
MTVAWKTAIPRAIVANSLLLALGVGPLLIPTTVWLILFFGLLFVVLGGRLIGGAGYRHWADIGLWAMAGWAILTGGLLWSFGVVPGVAFVVVGGVALNYLVLTWLAEPPVHRTPEEQAS